MVWYMCRLEQTESESPKQRGPRNRMVYIHIDLET